MRKPFVSMHAEGDIYSENVCVGRYIQAMCFDWPWLRSSLGPYAKSILLIIHGVTIRPFHFHLLSICSSLRMHLPLA
jgi:hypothetical protein